MAITARDKSAIVSGWGFSLASLSFDVDMILMCKYADALVYPVLKGERSPELYYHSLSP